MPIPLGKRGCLWWVWPPPTPRFARFMTPKGSYLQASGDLKAPIWSYGRAIVPG